MNFIEFKKIEKEKFVLIEFVLNRDLEPEDLKEIFPPDAVKEGFAHKGIILSGRGPVWLYGFLVHFYHPTKFVATFDPRLNAAVVVESHCKDFNVGDLVVLNE